MMLHGIFKLGQNRIVFLSRHLNGCGWKGPLEDIWPKVPAQAGILRASRPALWPESF